MKGNLSCSVYISLRRSLCNRSKCSEWVCWLDLITYAGVWCSLECQAAALSYLTSHVMIKKCKKHRNFLRTRKISEHVEKANMAHESMFEKYIWFKILNDLLEDISPITFKHKPLINFPYFCSSVCHLILFSVFVVMIYRTKLGISGISILCGLN